MKRQCIGPRGGITEEEVSCYTCVCSNKCGYTGPCTKPYGCDDWVSDDGKRALREKREEVSDDEKALILA
jgi:hypothetical protein